MDEEMFGQYRLDALIGRGGMGEVHRAYDTVRNRMVALKRLPAVLATDPVFRARFRAEAALVATLTEPHIVPVHDFGEIDGRLYIDMRLVEGEDLAALLGRTGPLPPARVANIVTQVAAALDAAHAEHLVHRDIKPANVLVTGAEDAEFVYVADFGIARALVSGSTSLTATGTTVGSVDYMAPERFADGHGDHRVDVYALGCLLFELLTSRRPFPVEGLPAMINAHLNTPPPRPSEHVAGLPTGLDRVVAVAMAKDPDDRYASAGALAADVRAAGLRSAAVGAVGVATVTVAPLAPVRPVRPAAGPPAPPARSRRHRGLLVLTAVAAVLAVLGGGTIALGLGGQSAAPDVVREPLRTPGDSPFLPPVGTDRDGVTPPPRAGGTFGGETPGLYGGTMNNAACDPEAMSAYLQADPAKAAAWARVQGIPPDRIPSYVARLTPVVLRSDTAVTNHGFAGGRATPFPAVLQAGTAVLVDEFGVPRAKCYCGNPLAPATSTSSAGYTGPSWAGFAPDAVTSVTPSPTRLAEFTMVDPSTDQVFYRTVGSRGDGDRAETPTDPATPAPDPAQPFTPERQVPSTPQGPTVPDTGPSLVETEEPRPPAAPSGLTATPLGPTSIELRWTDNSAGVATYQASDGTYGRSVPDSVSRYVWTGLDPDTRVCFQVTAFTPAGASAPSNEACATTEETEVVSVADLSPTDITSDSPSPTVGSPVYFDSGIRNSGNAPTEFFNIKWFVNGQEVGAYGGHYGIGANTVVSDGNSQFAWTFDEPGYYEVTFLVDADDFVVESDEGNNSRTAGVTVS